MENEELQEHEIPTEALDGRHSLMEIFDVLSFKEKVHKVLYGLKQPKDSGDYKYAKLQVLRLMSPTSAVLVPLLIVLILAQLAVNDAATRIVEVTVIDPEAAEKLEDIEDIIEEEFEPPEIEVPDQAMADFEDAPPAPSEDDFSPTPAEFDSVAIVKSPVILRGIVGSRSGGARGRALSNYGGSAATERSVLLALRWLKKYQENDGAWRMTSGGGEGGSSGAPALTALGLLTFLAHGETPASEEFGPTVERAIRWLVQNQNTDGTFKERDTHNYSQPIVAYALCEAYALTQIPMLKEPTERAMAVVIKGQNANGNLWNYNFNPVYGKSQNRNDLSFSGWCVQALKAASMAGIEVDGLKACMNRAIAGLKQNYKATEESGGFTYTTGGYPDQLTCVGVLSMQFLGYGKSNEVKMGLKRMQDVTCDWKKPWQDNPLYLWYYVTQAKFHAGGGTWNSWNREFSPTMVKNQTIIQKAIKDLEGNLVDIGYWKPCRKEEYCKSHVYNTTLCALMLQVYYRYLPTYKPPEDVAEEVTLTDEEDDIDVQVL